MTRKMNSILNLVSGIFVLVALAKLSSGETDGSYLMSAAKLESLARIISDFWKAKDMTRSLPPLIKAKMPAPKRAFEPRSKSSLEQQQTQQGAFQHGAKILL